LKPEGGGREGGGRECGREGEEDGEAGVGVCVDRDVLRGGREGGSE